MSTQRKSGGVTTTYDYCGAFDRVYKGPFNRVSVGVGPGCELKDKATQGDEYACKPGGTPTQCLTYADATTDDTVPNYTDGYWRVQLDAMSLLDGMLVQVTDEGSCCRTDGTCDITTFDNCTSPDIFHSGDTTCEMSRCCPQPFANSDAASGDTDVDLVDFGAFQRCYTGLNGGVLDGCACFNKDGDNDVDDADFDEFQKCWSGPNVPYSGTTQPPPPDACSPDNSEH